MTYRNRLIAELSLLALAGLAYANTANAAGVDYSVGSTQYCAQSVAQTPQVMTFANWALGVCHDTPPPIDPTIIQRANVAYRGGGSVANVDVTDFANIFGRAGSTAPVQQYPYVTGSTPSVQVQAGRSLGPAIRMPSNPGTAGHTLKANNYGATNNKQFKAKMVPLGGNWSTPVWRGCEQSGHQFSENATIFNIRIGPPPANPNPSFCYVNPGAVYVPLLAWVLPTDFGTMGFTWY